MIEIIDPKYPYWQVDRYAGTESHWKLDIDSSWMNEDASPSFFVLAYNLDGTPAYNERAVVRNGGEFLLSFRANQAIPPQSQADYKMYNAVFYPPAVGPYSVQIQGNSDRIFGMGLPVGHHNEPWMTFKFVSGGNPVPNTIDDAVRAAADAKKPWLPIFDGSALQKYAAANKLGQPQTDEFEFMVDSIIYVGQVFNLGIAYARKGDWANITTVKKT